MDERCDIVVIGSGLAGASSALALRREGHAVTLVAPADRPDDARTTALLMPSIAFLDALGVVEAVRSDSAPLETMRIVDATARLVRAPTVSFRASEIGETAFGYNIPNAKLLGALREALLAAGVSLVEQAAAAVTTHEGGVTVLTEDGDEVCASLVVAADGRRSIAREAAGIGVREWRYRQSALVTTFGHTVPHRNISTEFHTADGPFTTVPLPGNRSSLVWVVRPEDAEILATLGTGNLAARIEERMQSMLGAVTVDGPVQTFPLSGMIAHRFGQDRTLLVGEAAHVFPPIGAQGLNLGLRDVASLADAVRGRDVATEWAAIVQAYDRGRRADVTVRTAGVDLLNRSLLSDLLPVQVARSAGLAVLGEFGLLRNLAMREGMRPGGAFAAAAGAARSFGGRLRPGRTA